MSESIVSLDHSKTVQNHERLTGETIISNILIVLKSHNDESGFQRLTFAVFYAWFFVFPVHIDTFFAQQNGRVAGEKINQYTRRQRPILRQV